MKLTINRQEKLDVMSSFLLTMAKDGITYLAWKASCLKSLKLESVKF